MNNEVVDKLQSALEILANQLGQGVDHFWPLFIREQSIRGFMGVIFFLLVLVIIFIFLKITPAIQKKAIEKNKESYPSLDEGWHPNYGVPYIFVSIFIGIALMVSLVKLFVSIPLLLNPEYHAIQAVFDLVK